MTSKRVKVSIGIPAYNASAQIERCLRAVLNQQPESREILFIDNASTDDTLAKARAILDGRPGARIEANEVNLGRVENWNRCLELASGDYLQFAFTNDVLLPGGLNMLLAAMREQPDTVMVCSKLKKVDEVPSELQPVAVNPAKTTLDAMATLKQFARFGNATGSLGGMLVRLDTIRRRGLRFRTDLPYCADFYFAIALANEGKSVFVNRPCYLLDSGANTRFARSGISKMTYFFENRECALQLKSLFARHGVENHWAFEYLYRAYLGLCLSERQPPLSKEDTAAVFAGAGPFLESALKSHQTGG